MPRVQMTRPKRIVLYLLVVYLAFMLSLILVKFLRVIR